MHGGFSFRVNQTKKWWKREFSSEYLYALTKDTAQLKEFLKGKNYLNEVSQYWYSTFQHIHPLFGVFFPAHCWCMCCANSSLCPFITLFGDSMYQYICVLYFYSPVQPNMRDYDSPMLPWLLYIRQMSSQLAPPLLLWCLFFSATAASITVALLCSDRQRIPQSNNQKVDIRDYLAAM